MELSVSNDFLSLFLPEQSDFKTEEILDEFKIYIFRLMNITVDSLIQEQINNDYENNQLKKKYKDFFSERIDSVLNVNDLYGEIVNKTNVIKASLEKNITTIEQNRELFNEEIINKDLEKITNDIKINKNIIKNQIYLDLLAIPSSMIQCFQKEEYDLYIEYLKYGMNLPDKMEGKNNCMILTNLKKIITHVDKMIRNLMTQLLSINYLDLKIENEVIFDILQLEPNNIFLDENIKEIDYSFVKKVSVILYQIDLYLNHKNIKINFDLLTFFADKISYILNIQKTPKEKIIIKKIYNNLFEKYLFDIIKSLFNDKNLEYLLTKEKICILLDKMKLFEINAQILNEIDKIFKKYFYYNIDKYIGENEENIKNYLLMTKDVKKFFAALIPPTANKNILNLKYEILFIIYNNLSFLNNIIVTETFISHKDKIETIKRVNKHCNNLIQQITQFFYDNYYHFRITTEFEKEFTNFKLIFITNILSNFLNDIYSFFKMTSAFDKNVLYAEKEFNSLNSPFII